MGLVYLVRHGETDWNKKGQFRGRADVSLNAKGIQQAVALARFFSPLDLAAVYTSPLKRARQTAEVIAKKKGLKLKIEEGFVDVDYGEWQGLSLEEIKKKFPLVFQKWLEKPEKVSFPRGENVGDVVTRTAETLLKLARKHHEETIVIVAHQAINKIVLYHFFCLRERIWEIPQEVAAVNLMSFDGESLKLKFHNYTDHLFKK